MMNKRILSLISLLVVVILAGAILAACGYGSTAIPVPTSTSVGNNAAVDGQAIMQQSCSVCHSITRVTSAHHTAAQWQNTVNRMINHGAKLTSKEEQVLLDYLAQNYK
jgi:cytochrome c5